ncbi:hypothetical protein ACWD3J_44080 [Streptomyces sp. NPDC002755]|uniref:hypothetical protein n=1 Tax=Streptomyces sp. NPDC002884 TaxID=3154544 RepID=UPI003326C055
MNHDPDSCTKPAACGRSGFRLNLFELYLSFAVGAELSSDHFLVELSNIRRWFDLCREGIESVDDLTLLILGAATPVSILLITVRGLLNQLCEVFEAWHRARRASRSGRRRREPQAGEDNQPS